MIAVTGANGLLGSYVVRTLHSQKVPFVALKRSTSDTSMLADLNGAIHWRDVDVMDYTTVQEALTDVTGVIHAAAVVSFNPREANHVMRVNVEGTRNLINACLTLGIKRLLHVSSVAALGRYKGQRVINEGNQWIDSPWNTNYGESKYQAELEVFRGQEEGLSTAIVNPSVILAPGNWLKSSSKIFKYVWNERPFYTDGSFNYVDARDAALLSVQLFQSHHEGERFILNAGTTSIKEFFDAAAASLGKRAPYLKVSRKTLNVAAVLDGLRARIVGAEPLITKETARLADSFFHYENHKILSTIRHTFYQLEDTLEWCAEFYRKQMELKN